MQDFNFISKVSKATPLLMQAAATGEHIKKAELALRKSGGKAQDYLTIELRDALITSYQLQSVNEQAPSDQFSLNFSKIEFEYKPQKADGSLAAPIKVD